MYFPNVFWTSLSICMCITFGLKFDNNDGVTVISYLHLLLQVNNRWDFSLFNSPNLIFSDPYCVLDFLLIQHFFLIIHLQLLLSITRNLSISIVMTLRSQLKVPRFGLFYFDSDKTLSVVPLKKVSKVLEGTNTTEGRVVEIFYGNVLLKAKIIAVDGKSNSRCKYRLIVYK